MIPLYLQKEERIELVNLVPLSDMILLREVLS